MSPVMMNPAARTQLLLPAVIGTVLLVALINLSTLLPPLWPINPTDGQWQYQAAAAVLRAAPQLGFLLIVIAFVGHYGGNYTIVRRASQAALVLAAVVVAMLPVFALGFMKLRRTQPPETSARFTLENLRVAGTSGVLAFMLYWAGRRGLAASEGDQGPRRREAGEGLVVGQVETKR